MRGPFFSADDRLIARLQAPPDLSDGMQSLAYWHERRRRLAWYRFRGRREATRMVARWEQRVRSAMFSQRGVTIGARASAGLLLTSIRLRRFSRRVAVATTIVVALSLLAAPFVVALAVLAHIL